MPYIARSENLSGLGGRMGTEDTWDNWVKHFREVENAKAFCEKDYRKETKNKKVKVKDSCRKCYLYTGQSIHKQYKCNIIGECPALQVE